MQVRSAGWQRQGGVGAPVPAAVRHGPWTPPAALWRLLGTVGSLRGRVSLRADGRHVSRRRCERICSATAPITLFSLLQIPASYPPSTPMLTSRLLSSGLASLGGGRATAAAAAATAALPSLRRFAEGTAGGTGRGSTADDLATGAAGEAGRQRRRRLLGAACPQEKAHGRTVPGLIRGRRRQDAGPGRRGGTYEDSPRAGRSLLWGAARLTAMAKGCRRSRLPPHAGSSCRGARSPARPLPSPAQLGCAPVALPAHPALPPMHLHVSRTRCQSQSCPQSAAMATIWWRPLWPAPRHARPPRRVHVGRGRGATGAEGCSRFRTAHGKRPPLVAAEAHCPLRQAAAHSPDPPPPAAHGTGRDGRGGRRSLGRSGGRRQGGTHRPRPAWWRLCNERDKGGRWVEGAGLGAAGAGLEEQLLGAIRMCAARGSTPHFVFLPCPLQ